MNTSQIEQTHLKSLKHKHNLQKTLFFKQEDLDSFAKIALSFEITEFKN